jgi:hypothetical protein
MFRVEVRAHRSGKFIGMVVIDGGCIAETGRCGTRLAARKRARMIIARRYSRLIE